MSVKIIFNCLKVSVVLIFLLNFQAVLAQSDFTAIDRKLEESKKELGGNAAVLVYKDGKQVYQKIMGKEFNIKTQVPISYSSEWLTAALVMCYVDQGKISLDDKISTYIPIFTKYAKGYITIRDCLSHLTGIEAEHTRSLFGKKKYENLEEEVNEFASKREIESNPGLLFNHSNIGLVLAARVLEIVTKRSFEQLMQEKITRPLMMRNTSFSSFNAVNPSSGAVSTAYDYIIFLNMLLNKGMYNNKRILSEKAVAEMQKIRTTAQMIGYAPKEMVGYNYGFGEWILSTDTNGNASALACPGFSGTWPMIDLCRGYTCVIFTKGDLKEEKTAIYSDIKKIIDGQIGGTCN